MSLGSFTAAEINTFTFFRNDYFLKQSKNMNERDRVCERERLYWNYWSDSLAKIYTRFPFPQM